MHATVVAHFATPERAASAAKQTFGGLVANLRSTVHDRDVTFTVELDATQTAQVIDQLTALMR
ncbi:MAG TPA: hypothetical protein VFV99_25285 [Kofleriaceae bacterium]|nr:hypothetical protein [Kofleriaceae bacterium]